MKNKFGYGDDEYSCFNNIIMRESMWRIERDEPQLRRVRHPAGPARIEDGLRRQRLADQPGHPDHWALGYMKNRYGSPCAAWSFKRSHGWY